MAFLCRRSIAARTLLQTDQLTPMLFAVAGIKDLRPPPVFKDVEFPERARLSVVLKVPIPPNQVKMPKMSKRLDLMRGPEEVHTELLHKQYGIQVLNGGRLRYGHFEMIRNTIRRRMNEKIMFAVWRVDPPWLPVTKKGQGKRMGGGKGSIDHYVTPVKKNRIVVEMGGHAEYREVKPILEEVVGKLPFEARAVSYEMLQEEQEENRHNHAINLNPYTAPYVIKHNMAGVQSWCSPMDTKWYWQYW